MSNFNKWLFPRHRRSIGRALVWLFGVVAFSTIVTSGLVQFGLNHLNQHLLLFGLLSFILLVSVAGGAKFGITALAVCAATLLWLKQDVFNAGGLNQTTWWALFFGVGVLFIAIVGWRQKAVARLVATTSALRESQSRFHALADVGQDILMTTSPSGAADYLNHHFYEYTGLLRAQSLGWNWLTALHPQDVHAVREQWRQAIERCGKFEMSCRLRSASGAFRWFVCRFSPIISADGSVARWFGVCTDVDELRHSEERYRVMFELSAAGQAQMDPHTGRFMRVNRKLCDMTGYSEAELLDTTFLHLVHVQDRSDAFAGFRRVVSGESPEFNSEHRVLRKDGQVQWVSVTTTLLRDADNCPNLALSIISDIHDRKRVEAELERHREHLELEIQSRTAALEQTHQQLRQRERMASIGTLAGGIGHDLGNLVLPILCRLDSLADQNLPEPIIRQIESVRKACVHLRRLSSGLRMLAMDPNERPGVSDATSIPMLWSNIELLIKRSLPKNVTLEYDVPDDLPDVAAAPHHLTHALLNLVANAGEATARGGRAKIWARNDPDQAVVQVAVMDNGCGMAPEVRKRAIEPFFTTKHRSLSTGLGLSQVHSFCKAIGGSLDIFSTPDEGTTVLMTLPQAGKHSNTSEFGSTDSLARVTMSDARMARYVKALLESSGFRVIEDVGEGEGQCNGTEPSLWIVDSAMKARHEISQFVSRNPEYRVILVGSPEWPVDDPAILVVDGSHRAMRSALRDVGKRLPDMSTRGVTP